MDPGLQGQVRIVDVNGGHDGHASHGGHNGHGGADHLRVLWLKGANWTQGFNSV